MQPFKVTENTKLWVRLFEENYDFGDIYQDMRKFHKSNILILDVQFVFAKAEPKFGDKRSEIFMLISYEILD